MLNEIEISDQIENDVKIYAYLAQVETPSPNKVFAAKMTTFAIKSELDAAHALLDLQNDDPGRDVDMESSAAIANILSSLISSKTKAKHHPPSSTPNSQQYFPRRWIDSSRERRPVLTTKIVYDQGTQTDFELYLPEVKKMENIIKELCAKIEILESKLKAINAETQYFNDSLEQMSDVSSEDYSTVQYTRKSHKRKRKLTTTDISSIADYSSSYTREHDESIDRDVQNSIKQYKKPLKLKNNTNNIGELVSIGDGNAVVPSKLLKRMDWSSYTNATRKLLTAVFTRKILATHSLTGRPSPAFPDKPAKKKLDPALVNDIVQTVVEKCSVPESVVRTSITTKCADESKMFRTRQQNKKKRKSMKKENISPYFDDSDNSYLSS